MNQVPPFPLTPLVAGNELLAADEGPEGRGSELSSRTRAGAGQDGSCDAGLCSDLLGWGFGVTLCGESTTLAVPGEVGLQNPYSLHLPLLSPLPPPSTGPLGGGWGRGVSDQMEPKHHSSSEHTAGCT